METASNNTDSRTFTLIELLVVIAIIGILAGMILPALSKSKGMAKGNSCLNNIKQMNAANLLYSHDYGYYMPCYGYEVTGPSTVAGRLWVGYRSASSGTPGNTDMTNGFIYNTIGNWKIMECPSWITPIEDPKAITDSAGYGYNVIGIGSQAYLTGSAYTKNGVGGSGMKVDKVKKPECTATFGDVTSTTSPGEIKPYAFLYPKYTIAAGPPISDSTSVNSRGDNVHFRHNRSANVGWADGHASTEKPSRINSNFVGAKETVGNFGPEDNSLFRPFELP